MKIAAGIIVMATLAIMSGCSGQEDWRTSIDDNLNFIINTDDPYYGSTDRSSLEDVQATNDLISAGDAWELETFPYTLDIDYITVYGGEDSWPGFSVEKSVMMITPTPDLSDPNSGWHSISGVINY